MIRKLTNEELENLMANTVIENVQVEETTDDRLTDIELAITELYEMMLGGAE